MFGEWLPIEGAPDGLAIDVFYRNATFTPAVEGIVLGATFYRNAWRDREGCGVPAIYAVSWRPSSVDSKAISSAA